MNRPTPEKARQRRALIEANLRSKTPIHSGPNWELYLSPKGPYIVRYNDERSVLYLAITSDGSLVDMVGYEVDGGDRTAASIALRGAGLDELAEKVKNWSRRPEG